MSNLYRLDTLIYLQKSKNANVSLYVTIKLLYFSLQKHIPI